LLELAGRIFFTSQYATIGAKLGEEVASSLMYGKIVNRSYWTSDRGASMMASTVRSQTLKAKFHYTSWFGASSELAPN